MSNDITLKPNFSSDNPEFEEYIEDIEINFKTNKDSFVGSFNSWAINMNLNRSNAEVPERIKLNLGINGTMQKMPTFILMPVSDDETEENLNIKGYDFSVLFDKEFQIKPTFPITLGNLAQQICDELGVELETTDFINSDFVIYREMVDNKKTYREVIAMIAAAAAGNAFINEEDKLVIRSFVETDIEVEEYFSSEKFVKVGPITGVNIAREPIKDYKTLNDADLLKENKSCVVKIINNALIDDNRELAIEPIFNQLKGIEFNCKKIETHEAYNIKPFSFINLEESKILVDSICIKYPSLVDSYVSSNQLNEVESNLNASNRGIKKRLKDAEAKVDEVEGKIILLATEITETEEKVSNLEVNVNSIITNVGIIADLTKTVSGINPITLEKCLEGELQNLTIKANNSIFNPLYPSTTLYPSPTLFPRGKTYIHVIHQTIDENDVIIETTKTIDLGLTEALRMYSSDIYDEFVYNAIVEEGESKAKVIRRVGVLSDGTLYALPEEIEETIEIEDILLGQGTNIITFNENHYGNISATYIQENSFTKLFATTYEVNSYITQLANEIDLMVKEKVGKNEIIADLNIAVRNGQGIIELIGDIVKITSKYFTLTADGHITATQGNIAGLVMETNDVGNSWLYKNSILSDGTKIQNGLHIAKESDGDNVFLYAGVDVTSGSNKLINANTYITEKGLIKAKWFEVNGESGYFRVKYDSGRRAVQHSIDGTRYYVDDEANGYYGYMGCLEGNMRIDLNDSPIFMIRDNLHYASSFFEMLTFYRYDPNSSGNMKYRHVLDINSSIWCYGIGADNVNNTIYIQGYEVTTTASDERLKENIMECTEKALDITNQIPIITFDWGKDTHRRDAGEHIRFGYGAQRTQKVYDKAVIYNKENDTYQMDLLNLSALHTKAIQELNNEIKKRDKIIEFLAEKLNCKDEVLEMLKEGE